jgi:hypothetical protein
MFQKQSGGAFVRKEVRLTEFYQFYALYDVEYLYRDEMFLFRHRKIRCNENAQKTEFAFGEKFVLYSS